MPRNDAPAAPPLTATLAAPLLGQTCVVRVGEGTRENFVVTPAMRAEVLRRLRAKGVEMSDQTFSQAVSLLDDQLGYEVARYVFGRPAEFRRRAQGDRQMQMALELLRRAQSPKDLLSAAMAQASAVTEGRN